MSLIDLSRLTRRLHDVQVNGRPKGFRALPKDSKLLLVKVLKICVALDHGPFEPELGDRSFQFVGGRFGVLSGKASEASKPVRVLANDFRLSIVDLLRRHHSALSIQNSLNPRRAA